MTDRRYRDWLRALGAPEDPTATDTTSPWSAMSLLKAIYSKVANGELAAGIAATADSQIRAAASAAANRGNDLVRRARRAAEQTEAIATYVRGAIAQCANYVKLSRANRVAAAASETAAGASATFVSSAVGAAAVTAGMAMFGQRAKRDRVAAQAAAASVPTADNTVLANQVFS